MKASRNPSPLREVVFEPGMRVLGRALPASPFTRLDGEEATAVRRRRVKPRFWVQLHLGFLCEERLKDTRRVYAQWQVGRQPGTWAWASLESAVKFMGGLEVGQGQPVVVSTWAPAWMSAARMLHVDVGSSLWKPTSGECWRLRLRGLPAGALAADPGAPVAVWRLKVGRQRADTDIRSWSQLRP